MNTGVLGGGSSCPPAGSSPPTSYSCNEAAMVHRRELSVVVACLLQEGGCTTIEKPVLGTLVEILQSTLVEMGRLSRAYCELAYRTEPVLGDVVLALADMGIKYDNLQSYSKRIGRGIVQPSPQQIDTKNHSILQVGDKKSHLSHIPDNLPSFPDTHTYCFTPTVKQPVTEYEAIREKAATQKRDIEKALTKFGTKTNPTETVFIADDKEYSLISVAPSASQNMDALMPKDQVFEAEHDYTVAKARRKRHDRLSSLQQQQLKGEGDPDQETKPLPELAEVDTADNPFLRPIKMPRKRPGRLKSPSDAGVLSPPEESFLGPNISKIILGGSNMRSSSRGDDVLADNDDATGAYVAPPSFAHEVPPSFGRDAPPPFAHEVPPSFGRDAPPPFTHEASPSFQHEAPDNNMADIPLSPTSRDNYGYDDNAYHSDAAPPSDSGEPFMSDQHSNYEDNF